MIRNIWPSFCLLVLFTLLCGFAYPLVMMQFGQAFFAEQANGSSMEKDGKIIGSYLLAYPSQSGKEYFYARPSQATVNDQGILIGAASNLAQTNSKMKENHESAVSQWKQDQINADPIPVEMSFASASGLDPNISYTSALQQANRIAMVRGVSIDDLYAMIGQYRKQVPLLKLDYVNINRLNRALDQWPSPDDRKH